MISLTLDGAERLASKGLHLVEIEDFDLTGNLFAKGVRTRRPPDPHRGRGDNHAQWRSGIAVGIASMSAREMTTSERGNGQSEHKRNGA